MNPGSEGEGMVRERWGNRLAAALAGLWVCAGGASAMDRVRQETRTDAAIAKYGVTGRGVIVAILDRGIDWRHPDFRNQDGSTRIQWLLDMSRSGVNPCDPNDPPPVEYSEEQINAALSGWPPIDTRDAVGHGTVTAGLAAGNGRAFADGKYRGMAPRADLIIVKFTSEGAPDHDDQPYEASFQGCADIALDWLDQKITESGKPCVALINSGVQWGPIDGTSATSRKIDQVFGLHRPGRVYVSASGDEGGYLTHAGGHFDETEPTVVRFIKWVDRPVTLPLWYSGHLTAAVSIVLDDGTRVGPVAPGEFVYNPGGVSVYAYWPGQEFYHWNSTSGDFAVGIVIEGHPGGGEVHIQALSAGVGRFDLYQPSLGGVLDFQDHLVDGRLSDYSSTRSAIVVGAHVNKDSHSDIDGNFWLHPQEGSTDQLWIHSSGGPTRDGRLGIDLTAPGHGAFAAYGPDSYWATFRFNLIHDGGGWYGGAGATSGSAPIVLGAVALMLDLCPNLTAEQVRDVLRATARADQHTGPVPNLDWGHGKLDVLAALDAVHALCPCDYDFDRDVDADDRLLFESCATGPEIGGVAAGCADRDLDHDGDVDAADYGLFQRCYGGPGIPIVPGCAR
jgi:subtilisin family serine protease